MALTVGIKAPDFTLKSKTAEGLVDVTLSANFGKKQTVLLFFPLAFTGVCTAEMCDITSGLSAYAELGADVIAISVDSPFAQEAWAQQNSIKLTIVSDLNKETTKAIREWAIREGYELSDRGRIPQSIIEAFEAAH